MTTPEEELATMVFNRWFEILQEEGHIDEETAKNYQMKAIPEPYQK